MAGYPRKMSWWCLVAVFFSTLMTLDARNRTEISLFNNTWTNFTLGSGDTLDVTLSNISVNSSFAMLHVHAIHTSVVGSLAPDYHTYTSVNSSDVGLLTLLEKGQSSVTWFVNSTRNETDGTKVWMMALEYNASDPIPGACNQEFPLENDPNIHVHYNLYETIVQFQFSNVGFPRQPKGIPECDQGSSGDHRLKYDVYQYYLPEHDFSEASLVQGLKRMTHPADIIANGHLIRTLDSKKKPNMTLASFKGQGVIYNVIVRDPKLNTSASYIPVHTYACSFTDTVAGCFANNDVAKALSTIAGVIGLFLCFTGHRYFKTELFIFGFLATMLITFILISMYSDESHAVRVGISCMVGSVGGILWTLFWWRFGLAVLSVLLVGLVLGYMFASIIFFTPFGNLNVWLNDFNYGMSFACGIMIIPVFLLAFTKTLSIVSCSVIGSYAVILALDAYLYTCLSYIALNPIKRAVAQDFRVAVISAPFQVKDYVLVALWVLLSILGAVSQFYRERGREDFPPCPYELYRKKRQESLPQPNIQQPDQQDREETEPLLSNQEAPTYVINHVT
ncbi:TM7SF3 [Branchiostoma lanceolatum]|uniref:TM7SF3 protein n=1 Tax=Branchiostoma lanceolatum TaxID=7740 RepID=A0A8J9ZNR5_BRALA|nr:TM7SF3 [Branchiostoma lanceolatum]